MREEPTRSLLLLDSDADERRLVSAIAARAGWSLVGAADEEMALALLQGPHGREVRAALLRRLGQPSGPAADRRASRTSPGSSGHRALNRRQRFHRRRGDARRRVRFPGPAGRVGAAARGARRQRRSPPRRWRACAGLGKARSGARARAAGRRRPRIPRRPRRRRQVGAAPACQSSIIGEPGTGKETIARAIHAASLRAKGPLLSLDCKAIAANIIDSELFGHEKGAFPGAFAPKTGKLVQADGGTLVLDEIARASGGDAGAARPSAGHGRSAAGRPQRQPFGRCPGHRDQQPAAPRRFPRRPGRADQRDRPSRFRRCATAAETFPRSPAICSAGSPTRPG